MKLHLDFGGFYDSIHMSQIESAIEYDSECMKDFNEDSIDWDQTKINYSEGYIDLLNNMLDYNLKFIEIDSPRFYNYRNDHLVVEINKEDQNKILDYIYDSNFIEYVDERLASRDGFHSFYDNGVQTPFDNLIQRALKKEESSMEHLLEMFIEWEIYVDNDIDDCLYDIEFEIEYVD